jgi:hypothetical protein
VRSEAFSEAVRAAGRSIRESIPAAAAQARQATGLKGKSLFHPLACGR